MNLTVSVSGGKISGDSIKERFMHLRDGLYEIDIKRLYAKRSEAQNRFYWGVIVNILAEHMGYLSHEMHMILREKFLTVKLPCKHDRRKKYRYTASTTDLTTALFSDYWDAIGDWAYREFDITLPKPKNEDEMLYWVNYFSNPSNNVRIQ